MGYVSSNYIYLYLIALPPVPEELQLEMGTPLGW